MLGAFTANYGLKNIERRHVHCTNHDDGLLSTQDRWGNWSSFLLKGYRSLCQMTQLRSAPERAVLATHEKQTDWQFNISGTSRRSYIITSFLKAKEDVTIIFPTTVLDDIGLIFADQFTG